MKKILLLPALLFCLNGLSQEHDTIVLRKIYDIALAEGHAYKNLHYLCKNIGHRLSGSPQAQKAVEWGKKLMEEYGFDKVYLQEVKVPNWKRSKIERASMVTVANNDTKKKTPPMKVKITALGGSVGTKGKISAEVIEVKSFDELEKLGKEKIKDKIVFFSQPMEPRNILTFKSYGGCVHQRVEGADMASKYGAKAVIIRSVTHAHDDHPHTGSIHYNDSVPRIPGAAVSTQTAEILSEKLAKGQKVMFSLELGCQWKPDTTSYNVVGEITGSKFPDQYIIVGGHLDSWDIGEGAHDDGAGIVHSIEALRIIKASGIRPLHTIRAVLFMNEENGMRGGYKYAELAKEKNELHIAAIESDRGGLVPRGFATEKKEHLEKMREWKGLLKPYELDYFELGGSGADIGPLRKNGNNVALIGFVPDSQRYFDFHHAETDVFENVNRRELELGAAAITSLIYLIDKYGI